MRRFLLAFGSLAAACAGIDHVADPPASSEGIRYYGTSPYLLIYSDSRGGIVSEILYLPDTTKLMSAEPYSYLSKLDTTLEFENGVLTRSTAEADSAILPAAAIAAVEKALPLLLAMEDERALPPPEVPAPYLFKIVVEGEGLKFIGGQGDTGIRVEVQ